MSELDTVIDVELAPAGEKRAKYLDGRIQGAKLAVGQAIDGWVQRVTEAYIEQIHLALGYDTWGIYANDRCRVNFGNVDDRRAAVAMLTGEGLSTRAIGSLTGVSFKTVSRDQQTQVCHDDTPDHETTGIDGKTYPREKKAVKTTTEDKPASKPDSTGRRNQKHQIRALQSLADQMKANADVLEGLFHNGIQKSCTPEARDAGVREIRSQWQRISRVLSDINPR